MIVCYYKFAAVSLMALTFLCLVSHTFQTFCAHMCLDKNYLQESFQYSLIKITFIIYIINTQV